ncbi:hypothetical protein [Acidipropionibacterium virtanenii]|uniref:Uncharacterized protein n=1 Tax=Acidipropionibacterium virtanenii TaxID=2057246 RepID=A0A344UWV4_9ACTN|nr:hypothetical protein [Acidipropionibacterium virtanenii]AXE39752.1 hypothetical protein JS278_02614 [Acidipropionibacterium virtanenii]
MSIDWISLARVAAVTVVAAVAIVSVVAGGATMLDKARARADAGGSGATGIAALGWAMIGVAGLFILFGLYLIVPYFH